MIEILNDFEIHLIEDGKRSNTFECYVGDVKEVIGYLNEMNVTFDGNLSRILYQVNPLILEIML